MSYSNLSNSIRKNFSNGAKAIALTLGVLAICFLISFIVLAWTDPTCDPTVDPQACNVPLPINVGPTPQIKKGDLTIKGFIYGDDLRLGNWGGDVTTAGDIEVKDATGTVTLFHVDGSTGNVSWSGKLTSGSVPWPRLTDFPSACPSGEFVIGVGSSLTCTTTPSGVTTFLGLTDTPSSYSGQGGKIVKVKADEKGLEFGIINGGGTVTSITAGAGLTATPTDPITTTGTLNVGQGAGISVTADSVSLNTTAISTCTNTTTDKIIWDSTNNRLSCATDQTGVGVGYWRLTDSGLSPNNLTWNVGIGTTNKLSRLTVVGKASFTATGLVSITANSTTVTGSGTKFLSEIGIGDRISISGEAIKTVADITSDTSLTVDSIYLSSTSSKTLTVYPSLFRLEGSTNDIKLIVDDRGYIGIGVNPPRYKGINIDGSVVAKSFKDIDNPENYFLDPSASESLKVAGKVTAPKYCIPGASPECIEDWLTPSFPSGTAGQVLRSEGGTTWKATSTIFIASDGKVGIGTTTPDVKLSVVRDDGDGLLKLTRKDGGMFTFNVGKGSPDLGIYHHNTNSTPFKITKNGEIELATTTILGNLSVKGLSSAYYTDCRRVYANSDGKLMCGTYEAGLWSATDSNIYYTAGNVGIGQTNPKGKLVVNNNLSGIGSEGDAIATYASSSNSAIYAEQKGSGYAGYFSGKVEVNGQFKLGADPSDSKRTGDWQWVVVGDTNLGSCTNRGEIKLSHNTTYDTDSFCYCGKFKGPGDESSSLKWICLIY